MIEKGVYVLGGVKYRDLSRDEYRKLCDFLDHAPIFDKFSTFISIISYMVWSIQE